MSKRSKACEINQRVRAEVYIIDKGKDIESSMMKICVRCKKELPMTAEYFSKDKTRKDGYFCMCKICCKEYRAKNKESERLKNKEYRIKHRDKIIQDLRNYHSEHREQALEYYNKNKVHYKEYRVINKDKRSQYDKEYHIKNRSKRLEYNKGYYKEHTHQCSEVSKKYYYSHKKEHALYTKEYRKTEVGHYKTICASQKRRAMEKSLPATLTIKQWNQIKLHFNNKCAYCREEKPLQQDHFIALNKGGEYTHNNIIPACQKCNSSKRNFSFFIWYPRQDFYSKKQERKILNFLNYHEQNQQLRAFI